MQYRRDYLCFMGNRIRTQFWKDSQTDNRPCDNVLPLSYFRVFKGSKVTITANMENHGNEYVKSLHSTVAHCFTGVAMQRAFPLILVMVLRVALKYSISSVPSF